MTILDIILGGLLVFAFYKGIKNGLFVELASLVSMVAGIYFAIKFSAVINTILSGYVHWNPNTIKITAFFITFVLVVFGVNLLGKMLTNIADFAFMGWINKLGGGFFRVLKTILITSVFLTLFAKINANHFFVKKETLDHSVFYNPIQKVARIIYPSLEKCYEKARK